MTQAVINTFRGLTPKKEDASQGIVLPALASSNVDLRNGVIKSFRNDTLSERGHSGEFIKFDGAWYSGQENYCYFKIRGFHYLIYKNNGVWKRIVRSPSLTKGRFEKELDLGIELPSEPMVEALALNENVTSPQSPSETNVYESAYTITWVREIDGFIDESGASLFNYYRQRYIGWKVKRPTTIPDGVVAWRIYRFDRGYLGSTSFKLVAEVPIGDNEYKDYKEGHQLSDVPDGLFEDAGVQVFRSPPVVVFDGIAKESYYNYYIGWKDNEIFFSEPNNPDSFPNQYKAKADDDILAISVHYNNMYIFTKSGVQRGVGNDPFTFNVLPGYIGERIANRNAVHTCELGLFYATVNGINRINQGSVDYISRIPLGDDYFKKFNPESFSINYANGIVYMFHNKGTLIYIPENGRGFGELSKAYEFSYYDQYEGVMYANSKKAIMGLHNGDESTSKHYKTGELTLSEPDREKVFEKVEFFGEGTITVKLLLDNKEFTQMEMNLSGMDRERVIYYPRGYTGRGGSFEIFGRGIVKEVKYFLNRDY